MGIIESYIQGSLPLAWFVIILSFVVLFKCADIFVDSAIAIAQDFKIPRIIIGLLLVSLATSAPELSVSMVAALKGVPKIALGNAVGSVICNEGLGLSLAGLLSAGAISVVPSVFRGSGLFLLSVSLLTYGFVFFDQTLSRSEGLTLVFLFGFYVFFLYRQRAYPDFSSGPKIETGTKRAAGGGLLKHGCLFALSLAGIIFVSDYIVLSATAIAQSFHVSESIIALTLVAFGTSVPEVATSITAVRKGEGAIAVGNILGSDIINICWVAGASAVANDLTLGKRDVAFMFPVMIIIVLVMFCLLGTGNRMTRTKGGILLSLYFLYLAACAVFFPPTL